MCFHACEDHFFLTLTTLNYTSTLSTLSRCTTVCLSTYLLKDILVISTFWWIWIKLLETFMCIAWWCGKTAKLSSQVATLFCICTSRIAQHFFQSWVLSVLFFFFCHLNNMYVMVFSFEMPWWQMMSSIFSHQYNAV